MSSSPQAAWGQAANGTAPSSELEAAEKFRQARLLLDQGRFQEACERFEESLKLASSPATLLNLGNCYEQYSIPPDLLRARMTFQRALDEARSEPNAERRQAWTAAASARLDAVTARLPKLTLVPSPTPGARVLVDGQPVAELSAPLPLNPGKHRIEASAEGKVPYVEEITLAVGQARELTLPALPERPGSIPTPAPPVEVELTPPADAAGGESRFGVLPWALMGGGAALAATALIPGFMANSKAGELDSNCETQRDEQGRRSCDPSYASTHESARTLATVADVLWISGAVIAGVGVTLYVLDDGGEGATTVEAGCFGAGCGLTARGRF